MGVMKRRTTVLALAVVALVAVEAIAAISDNNVYLPPNYGTMTPPPPRGTYTDPVFGTTITRISDASQHVAQGVVPEYSQSSSWNMNDTYLLLYGTTQGDYYLYDANLNFIRKISLVQEARWSRSTPHHFYYRYGNTIGRYDVTNDQTTLIAVFPQYSYIDFGGGSGDLSDNDRVTVVGNNRYVFIYDLVTQTQHAVFDSLSGWPLAGNTVNAVTMSKDGNSYVIQWNGSGGGGRGRGLEQYGINGNFMVQIQNSTSHMGMGRDLNGDPVAYTTNVATNPQQPLNNCWNGIVKITLDGNANRTCLLAIAQSGGTWGTSVHISAHGNDGWVYVSTYRPGLSIGNWATFDDEIFRVRSDGSGFERLAHHRSSVNSYWKTPHANISISGRRLVFGSDFMLSGMPGEYADTYVIDVTSGPSTSGYVLDGLGGVHSFGGAGALAPMPYFGFDAAVDLELAPVGGYVLDRFGGVWAGGGAPILAQPTPYFHFDAARDLELSPAGGYYVLDAFGGIHAGGGAIPVSPASQYFGWDIARDLELVAGGGFYVLDGYGQVHHGGGAPPMNPQPVYYGWDIVRDVELLPVGVIALDGWGGTVYGGGASPILPGSSYFAWDITRDLELDPQGNGYYVLDGYGKLHIGGTALGVWPAPPIFPFDIARDLELQ